MSGTELQTTGGRRSSAFTRADHGTSDQEFQQAYAGPYPGNIRPNPIEVVEFKG